MMGTPLFLDSANLSDLRMLFSEGVQISDVVIVIMTPNVLSRPWCLLEINEATRCGIPIVLVSIDGSKSWSQNEALLFADTLEESIERVNPGALSELRANVGEDLSELRRRGTLTD